MAFDGFPRGGHNFFRQLAVTQEREWFKAHKADYEELWLEPMTALFDELHRRLQRVFPTVKQSKPKVFRIYRDVRFSRDKAPFKTHIAAVLPLFPGSATAEHSVGFYCSFGLEEFAGCGRWMMEKDELLRFRKALLADKTGVPVAKAVRRLEAKGFTVSAHDALKRPPPGVPKDHPRLELLKGKGLTLRFPDGTISNLQDGKRLVNGLVRDVTAAAPLLRWLNALATGRPLPKSL